MNCHIILDAYVDAYMNSDMDAYITISAHLFIISRLTLVSWAKCFFWRSYYFNPIQH